MIFLLWEGLWEGLWEDRPPRTTGGDVGAGGASALDDAHQDHDHGHDQEEVDEATHGVGGDEAERPQDDEDDGDGPEHGLFRACRRTQARPTGNGRMGWHAAPRAARPVMQVGCRCLPQSKLWARAQRAQW